MSRTFAGQYRPPRELVAIAFPRLSGPGSLAVGADGIALQGTALDLPAPVPMGLALAGLLALGAAAATVFEPGRVVGLVILVAFVAWSIHTWRREYGVAGTHRIPWAGVEHAAHLGSDREVVVVSLRDPLHGAGTPDALFFAPTEGIEALLEAIRAHAPGVEVLGPLPPDDGVRDTTNDDDAGWSEPE